MISPLLTGPDRAGLVNPKRIIRLSNPTEHIGHNHHLRRHCNGICQGPRNVAIVEALREGWLGRLGHSDTRRAAFWFISAGPLIALIGLFLRHAGQFNDRAMLMPNGAGLAVLA